MDLDTVKSIDKALLEMIDCLKTCLLFCGGQTIAIAKLDNHFYAFDPHSRGRDGLLNPNGTAVLAMFNCLNGLVSHIERLFVHSLQLRPHEQFEIVPLNISQQHLMTPDKSSNARLASITIDDVRPSDSVEPLEQITTIQKQQESSDQREIHVAPRRSLESYFEDQKKRNDLFQESRGVAGTTKPHTRNEYMKNYMERRRKKETIKKQENDSARLRMQTIRSSSEGKQKKQRKIGYGYEKNTCNQRRKNET